MAAHLIHSPFQFMDSAGNPVVGGTVEFYEPNGSSTPKAVYSDKALTTSAGTSATLNALGMFTTELFGDGDYYIIIKYADGSTADDREYIEGEGSGNNAAKEWTDSVNPAYISATSFSVPGDLTDDFHAGRRIKTENTGGTVYSTIVSSVFSSVTTITVINDSGALDSGLSSVELGFLRADNQSFPALISSVVSGADVSELQLTGLSVPNDKDINVYIHIIQDAGGGVAPYIELNGDSTAANYYRAYSNDGAAASKANDPDLGLVWTGNSENFIKLTISPNTTTGETLISANAVSHEHSSGSVISTHVISVLWNGSGTISSIGIRDSSGIAMIAAGSRISIEL